MELNRNVREIKMPFISFIIPVYNTPLALLKKGLDIIINSGRDNYEVIIVDDGSANGAEKTCDEYAALFTSIRTIHQVNGGVSAARNRGIVEAKGEYVIFVDPDDFIHQDIFRFKELIQGKPDVIIFDYIRELSNSNQKIIRFGKYNIVHDELIKNILFDENIYGDYYAGAIWAKAFRRQFLIENNLIFDVNLRKAQDRVFMLYVYEKAQAIQTIPLISYIYYENLESICNAYQAGSCVRSELFLKAICRYFESYPANERLKNRLLAKVFVNGFFEILYLDFFHIHNTNNYITRFKKANSEYAKLRINKILNGTKIKDFANHNDKIKYLFIKYRLWPILNVIICYKQKRRLIRNIKKRG